MNPFSSFCLPVLTVQKSLLEMTYFFGFGFGLFSCGHTAVTLMSCLEDSTFLFLQL